MEKDRESTEKELTDEESEKELTEEESKKVVGGVGAGSPPGAGIAGWFGGTPPGQNAGLAGAAGFSAPGVQKNPGKSSNLTVTTPGPKG